MSVDVPERFRDFAGKMAAVDERIDRITWDLHSDLQFKIRQLHRKDRRVVDREILDALKSGVFLNPKVAE